MSYKKIILLILSIIVIGFLLDFWRMQIKYDKVYKERHNVEFYKKLYDLGILTPIKDFVISNFDKNKDIVITTKSHKIQEIWLKKLKEYTNDSKVKEAINKLIENGFYELYASESLISGRIEISIRKKFLYYNDIPTYHCLIYDTEKRNSFRFDEKNNWYVFSMDSPEDTRERFLDFTPEWLIPYLEAKDFFRYNKSF